MGLQFGNLPIRLRKIVYYTLSATDQKFWAKSISHGLPNFCKRAVKQFVPMIPGLLMTIFCVTWAPMENKKSKRKDPKVYENDK
ncbi:unnamed protein product [Xylocopa violacea]|uniref:Cytochrome b-c1 complex subunit 8 n=1 Tax=Xylocopa violacea TaxID=135666 RepID=A0ABP1P1T7_XYLVO